MESLQALRDDAERLVNALAREYYDALSGQKAAPELSAIYARHNLILGRSAIDAVSEAFRDSAEGSDQRHSAQSLLEWIVQMQSGRAVSTLDDRALAWQAGALVRLSDGREIPYHGVPIELANSGDAGERAAIEQAREALVERELAPLKRERFEREREFVESLGIADGYNATCDLLSDISLETLRTECADLLGSTQALWDDQCPRYVKKRLGMDVADASSADALALFRGRSYDRHFPASGMNDAIRRQIEAMGLALDAGGRIHIDVAERAGKSSRAFCAYVRIPDEIYLVLRPYGGRTDWIAFLHELGHSLHLAHMQRDLPMEHRYGGDISVSEAYASLFDHLPHESEWLARYTDMDEETRADFVRDAAFEELHFLRRFCAKLIYETHLYDPRYSAKALPDLYVELLSSATSFRHSRAYAFVDVDPRYYSARYLRARQLQAVLRETLVERFGDEWWHDAACGPWLVEELFARGQSEPTHALVARVTGKALSFAPILRRVERALSVAALPGH
jgi:hypothetical protein